MTSDFMVPEAIEDVIKRFGSEMEFFTEHTVNQALLDAAKELKAITDAEQAGVFAERLPFMLTPAMGGSSHGILIMGRWDQP